MENNTNVFGGTTIWFNVNNTNEAFITIDFLRAEQDIHILNIDCNWFFGTWYSGLFQNSNWYDGTWYSGLMTNSTVYDINIVS